MKTIIDLNCISLGKTSLSDSFTVHVCDTNNINGNYVNFDKLKIGDLNDDLKDINTEEQIKNKGEKLVPINYFTKYFSKQDEADKNLIFIQVPATTAMNPTDLAFVFIDNTNVCEQGKKMVMSSENVLKDTIGIDYGRLVNFVLNGRKMGDDPVIAGSLPYMDDTLWKYLKEIGFKAHKFPRNSKGQEKEVDSEVNASMADVMERHKRPGTIILLAGDGDYGPRVRRALLRGWTVEIWFWRIGKKYLEIYGNIVKYESTMTCCVEMGLFCAWCKFDNGSLKMYCNTFDDWEAIKNYMRNKYPQAQEIIQVGDVSH
ncbi:hypothetical protein C1645_830525 [Glomus cerebriforme]|uniref:NYN domain-containing protein n=1 Tax=Glomus cerebriforme TaxID=658196 RepID=A0A397SHU1_9GLOM|nr:hypothetical protein C1645_830525 [Glomus cerebriforme]